jgi:hypothetical protein
MRTEVGFQWCSLSQKNASKPRKHSINTKKCAPNVSERYSWRDYYARKIKDFCHKMYVAILAIGPIHCFPGVLLHALGFVSCALTDRQVQALLAPNYRWLDPQQRSKKDRLLNAWFSGSSHWRECSELALSLAGRRSSRHNAARCTNVSFGGPRCSNFKRW